MSEDWQALRQETDSLGAEYPSDAYLLYSMGLRLRTMDYESLHTDCVLDGPDDKKIDFFHLDLETGVATIAQSYQSEDWDKPEPPSNKAADLNTAINWLLESELENIPRPAVKACAQELRDGLKNGEVTRLEVFYVHNLPKSDNVERELGTVQRALQTLLQHYSSVEAIPPESLTRQVSREVVEEWRRAQHEAISIHDEIELTSTIPPQDLETSEWRSVIASIPAQQIVGLRMKYGDNLFSANVRDYLGSRQVARNINQQIERTAQEEPLNFWVYNNGITLLTKSINTEGNVVKLSGIAVINGAQTVGSLAEAAARGNIGDAQVLVRAIKCNDPSLVDSVIRYNNTQNPIKPWELRVIDPIQGRIKEDFERIGVTYQLRRGSTRRRGSDVLFEKLAPYLSAFYGDPIASHKNKAELFENERRYRHLFDDDTRVKNLLFVYRLGNAIALTKANLREKLAAAGAAEDVKKKYDYFRYGASAFALIYVCGEVLGLWVEPKDANFKRRITFEDKLLVDQEKSEALLSKLTGALLGPVTMYLSDRDTYQELKTQAGIEGLATYTKTIIEQVHEMKPDTYNEYIDNLVIL